MSNPTVTPDDTLLPSAPASDRGVPSSLPKRRRLKAPKDTKMRKAVLAALIGRQCGLSRAEVAEQLGISARTLNTYCYKASKAGWLTLADYTTPEDALEFHLSQKAIRNVDTLLDDAEGCKGDKEVTLEVMKGLGLLKQHQVQKSEGGPSVGVALKVQVEMPFQRPDLPSTVDDSRVGGRPLYEAELVDVPE